MTSSNDTDSHHYLTLPIYKEIHKYLYTLLTLTDHVEEPQVCHEKYTLTCRMVFLRRHNIKLTDQSGHREWYETERKKELGNALKLGNRLRMVEEAARDIYEVVALMVAELLAERNGSLLGRDGEYGQLCDLHHEADARAHLAAKRLAKMG